MRQLILAAAVLAASALPAAAQTTPQRLITVTGTASVEAAPDRAELRAGVVAQGPTAAAALAQDSADMQQVFAALEKLGIARENIGTSYFSISPNYSNDDKLPRQIVSYTVTNTVTVTLKGTAKLGAAVDAVIGAGANQIFGVDFAIADPSALLAKARAEAVRKAQAEAQTYAAAAGVVLGPIASISTSNEIPPQPLMMMRAAVPATPFAPSTQNVSAAVTISWVLQ